MNILLDTTVLIDLMRGAKDRARLLAGLRAQKHKLAISAVSVAELFSGLKPEHEERAEALLAEIEVVAANHQIARRAGQLRFHWARKGVSLSLPDTLIAATAMETGAQLATDNGRHFPMRGLVFYALPG